MTQLRIPIAIRDHIVDQARTELPNECCGLLVGHGDTVTHRFRLVNELASSTRFRSQPESMFRAMKQIRTLNLNVLAIYHSHPTSDAVPSKMDLEEATWPGVATLIVSLNDAMPVIRAWHTESGIIELPIIIS